MRNSEQFNEFVEGESEMQIEKDRKEAQKRKGCNGGEGTNIKGKGLEVWEKHEPPQFSTSHEYLRFSGL